MKDSIVRLTIRRVSHFEWQLFTEDGREFGPRIRGTAYYAQQYAKAFVSTWYNFRVNIHEETTDADKDQLS